MNPKKPECNKNVKSWRQGENLKSGKRKTTCYTREQPPYPIKTMSRFLSKNFAGQKEVAWYIQSAQRKTLPTKNTLDQMDLIENIPSQSNRIHIL